MLALFKNEGDILWEWSRHYLDQGVTQIILINNCSDDWRGALGELGQDPGLFQSLNKWLIPVAAWQLPAAP